jgi:hypothetical protein
MLSADNTATGIGTSERMSRPRGILRLTGGHFPAFKRPLTYSYRGNQVVVVLTYPQHIGSYSRVILGNIGSRAELPLIIPGFLTSLVRKENLDRKLLDVVITSLNRGNHAYHTIRSSSSVYVMLGICSSFIYIHLR